MSISLLRPILPALDFALMVDGVMNGLPQPFFGWVSNRISGLV